jgi:hypothetical protein
MNIMQKSQDPGIKQTPKPPRAENHKFQESKMNAKNTP